MKLINQTASSLSDYVVAQIDRIVPDNRGATLRPIVAAHLDEALARTQYCIDRVKMWRPEEFNYLHSSQYCIFLYFLASTIWRATRDPALPTRLFLLNKTLSGIDLFYEIEMPKVFFIGHTVGIVLAKARYGEYLALYQNSTVGRSGADIPCIGERVVLHPNCAVIGRSVVADGTVLSYGTQVINRTTEPGMVAYNADGGSLSFRQPKRKLIQDFFRFD